MTSQIKFERVLFATDFLESSRLALDYAVAFAGSFGATIVMLHVLELTQAAREAEAETSRPSLMRRVAEERLEVLAAGVRRLGFTVEVSVEDGIPCQMILQAVDKHRADLLVLGVHGIHRGLEHLLIGSNTEKILLSAKCPTLTVGAHVLSGIGLELRTDEIIYFNDFTAEATAASPYSAYLSEKLGAPTQICQISSPNGAGNHVVQDQPESIEKVVPSDDLIAKGRSNPVIQLRKGEELEQVLSIAKSHNAGMIVLGVRPASQLSRHLYTSFAYNLLATATCPVFSVRYSQGSLKESA